MLKYNQKPKGSLEEDQNLSENLIRSSTMEKSEVINNLYAIRAGLSAISVNYDKMVDERTRIKSIEAITHQKKIDVRQVDDTISNTYQREKELERMESDLHKDKEKTKKSIEDQTAKLEELKIELERKKFLVNNAKNDRKCKKEARKYARKSRFVRFFLIEDDILGIEDFVWNLIIIPLACWLIPYLVIKAIMDGIENMFHFGSNPADGWIVLGGVVIYPLVLIIKYIITMIIETKSLRDAFFYNLTKETEQECKTLSRNIEDCERKIESLKKELGNFDYKFKDIERYKDLNLQAREERIKSKDTYNSLDSAREVEKKNNQLIEECKRQIQVYAKENKLIKQALISTYNPILNVSDWGSLDNILYYLITNRADSVKEALQLMDRQNQTNAITDAISSAGSSISGAITQGFNELQSSLSTHFKNLSTKISSIESSIEAVGRQNAISAAMISDQISDLIDATEMQTAFMQKSMRGVRDLLDDMNNSEREFTVKFE